MPAEPAEHVDKVLGTDGFFRRRCEDVRRAKRMAEMASNKIDLSAAVWRKSTYSNGDGGNCAEVCDAHTAVVPVRDSKVPHGPVLTITAPAWTSFVASLK